MPRRRRPLSRRHGVRAMLLAHHAQRRRALAAHPRGGKDDVGPVCVKQPRHRRRCRPAARAARAAVLLRRRARGQDRAARVHRVLRAGVAAQARGAGRLLRRVLRVADGAALLHPLQFGSLLLQRPRRRAAPRPGSARGRCRRAGAGALLRAPAVERLSAPPPPPRGGGGGEPKGARRPEPAARPPHRRGGNVLERNQAEGQRVVGGVEVVENRIGEDEVAPRRPPRAAHAAAAAPPPVLEQPPLRGGLDELALLDLDLARDDGGVQLLEQLARQVCTVVDAAVV
mmetsp:Transcript_8986/g.28791  ORF Transcript_8986/g.28791 Transcript_8986/m.28791 type:complete len:285 (-) Transcript_8986:1013-1867(-)